MTIYHFGDIVESGCNLFLFLDKYIIYDLNHKKLIDNYKYRGKDNYIYVPLTKLPHVDRNNVYINDNFMFHLLKVERNANLVKTLPIAGYDKVNLIFNDCKFLVQSKTNFDLKEMKLCKSLTEQNYLQVISSIINKDSLMFDFCYDENTKSYIHQIKYLNILMKNMTFLNDNFIFDILNSLLDMLSNNDSINYDLKEEKLTITGDNDFCINLYNFNREIVIYIIEKLRIDNVGKKL